MSLLLFNQDREYHLREIARLVKISPVYVSKELDNLCRINLVKKKKTANLSIYSVNRECVFLAELRRIYMKTDYLGELIRRELKNEDVRYCLIFGSFAQGTESSSSDIDLFLVSEIKEDRLIGIIQGIEKTTQREINYVLWDQEAYDKRAKDNNLLANIRKGKVIMLVGDDDEFRGRVK